jgi:HAD superfamily hydrolase (TIGR01549 family)
VAHAALLDLDGTLVDSNYQHALAWYRAFRRSDIVLPMWRLHRHIGMGGDQYVPAVAGEEVERRCGDVLREAHAEEFAKLRDECEPLDGARDLIVELKRRGHTVVLASSAKEPDLDHFLAKLDAKEIIDGYTTATDVKRTKPHPDLVLAALEKAGTNSGVMVGDSRWDIEAAAKAGLETICLITGGWSKLELAEHGATAVYDSIPDLIASLDDTPLAG